MAKYRTSVTKSKSGHYTVKVWVSAYPSIYKIVGKLQKSETSRVAEQLKNELESRSAQKVCNTLNNN